MRIWDWFKSSQTQTRDDAPEETRSLASPESWLLSIFGIAPTVGNVSVTPENACRSPAVKAAVAAISDALGTMPAVVYQRDSQGSRTRANDHPISKLIHGRANDWTPSAKLIEQWGRDTLLWGNGFIYINRVQGQPRELIRLHPGAVNVKADDMTGEPRYEVAQRDGQNRSIPRQDILHLQAPGYDGVKGVSPVIECREAIAVDITLRQHVNKLFSNGGRPGGVLKFPKSLGSEAASKMKASWETAHGGENSGGTAVLEEGGEYQPIGLKSTDAQTLELWQFAILEIARVFRVPPVLLFDYARATWSNSETSGAQFLVYSLQPWITRAESEINLKLLTEQERDTYFVEFLVDGLLRADFTKRAAAYAVLRSNGIFTANEIRALENMPPHPDGDKLDSPHVQSGAAPTNADNKGAEAL